MECKLLQILSWCTSLPGINRNIVECKYVWQQATHKHPEGELIETLWNVNLTGSSLTASAIFRINRNIVECKYTHNLYDNLHYLELIETLWNVNDIQEYHFQYKL